MNAVLLAAGRGTRLAGAVAGPKCLARVGDRTLLDRYLDALLPRGVAVHLVTGFGAEQVCAQLAGRPEVAVHHNAAFVEGSVVSCAVGLAAAPGPVLLMDGDVACEPALYTALLDQSAPDALLVDLGAGFTDEEYLAGVEGDRAVALRRGPVPQPVHGEWVGFARLSAASAALLHAGVQGQLARGERSGGYEDALATLLPQVVMRAVPTAGRAWVEVDFPHDLARARGMLAQGPWDDGTDGSVTRD